jgi:hypothetical protein
MEAQGESTKYHAGAKAAQKFKDFTREIVSVPKSEIDKAAKKLPPQKVGAKRVPKPNEEIHR